MIELRPLVYSDLAFLVAVRNACRNMLHDAREFSVSGAQQWFHCTQPRFYIVAANGIAIGYFRTSNWSDTNRNVYVGCDLEARYQGRGLATAAYGIFLRFLFDDCGMNKVSLEVLEHNDRARRLYGRLGFVPEGIKRQEVWREGRYLDSLMFSMLRSEFDSMSSRLSNTIR